MKRELLAPDYFLHAGFLNPPDQFQKAQVRCTGGLAIFVLVALLFHDHWGLVLDNAAQVLIDYRDVCAAPSFDFVSFED